MSDLTKVEYRVRPVVRYMVTRYEEKGPRSAGSTPKGEFDNAHIAYEVGCALAKDELQRLGWLSGDERMLLPIPFVDIAERNGIPANEWEIMTPGQRADFMRECDMGVHQQKQ